jgi:hypothetical protein
LPGFTTPAVSEGFGTGNLEQMPIAFRLESPTAGFACNQVNLQFSITWFNQKELP